MATYLFCWELGQGLGHLVRYKALINQLIDRGHRVHYLARDAERVRLVNPQNSIHIEEIQPEFTAKEHRIKQPANASPATLLLNCGFSSAERLAVRAKQWITRIRDIKPSCIIADHSPTAIFANKFLNYPIIISGNGFTAPPAENPFRLFQYWRFNPSEDSIRFEAQVAEILNEAASRISSDVPAFEHPSELFKGDQRWLMTFREFDSYGPRPGCEDYVGTFAQRDFGEGFVWPSARGPRVFAYLSKTRGLEYLAEWARSNEVSLCLYGKKLPRNLLDRFDAERTYFAPRPVRLANVFDAADLAITNGSANTVANFALAGIPQFAIPQSVENLMESRRLEILGCGLMANLADRDKFVGGLNALIANGDYRRSARKLKRKYENENFATSTQRIYKQLMEF